MNNKRISTPIIIAGFLLALLLLGGLFLLTSRVIMHAFADDDVCMAARIGENARLRYLLQRGANPNARTDEKIDQGKTALIIAIENHQADCVKLLLDYGADPGIGDSPDWFDGGIPAFDYAVAGDLASFKYVYNYCEDGPIAGFTKVSMLFAATSENNLAVMEYIIHDGISPRATDPNGDTPLHYACSKKAVKLLVRLGADVNAKDNNGETPLHKARNKEVAMELLRNGANRSMKTKTGLSVVDTAKRDDRHDVETIMKGPEYCW